MRIRRLEYLNLRRHFGSDVSRHSGKEAARAMCDQNRYAPPSQETGEFQRLSDDVRSVSFLVSEEEQLACAHQYFFRVALDARWMVPIGVTLFGLFLLILGEYVYAAIMLTLGLLNSLSWVRAYCLLRSRVLTEHALLDGNLVTISSGEDGITRVWGGNSVTIGWAKINRVRLSEDFIFLMHDKVPLMAIPKRHVSDSFTDFMLSLDRRVSITS